MPKKKRTEVVVMFPQIMNAGGLIEIARQFPQEEIPEIIAALDLMCEDWDITEEIVNHFLHLAKVGESELGLKFMPKEIKTNLHFAL